MVQCVYPHDVVIEWDEQRAEAIIRGLCWRNRKLFDAYPESGHDDRVQECLAAARTAWNVGRYNPWLGTNVSTWLNRVCVKNLVSMSRRLAVRHRYDKAAARPEAFAPHQVIRREYDRSVPLEEWFAGVVQAARHLYPVRKHRRRFRKYRRWQMVASVLLMQRMQIGTRYFLELMGLRPELRKLLCFKEGELPGHRRLRYAAEYVRDNLAVEADEPCPPRSDSTDGEDCPRNAPPAAAEVCPPSGRSGADADAGE